MPTGLGVRPSHQQTGLGSDGVKSNGLVNPRNQQMIWRPGRKKEQMTKSGSGRSSKHAGNLLNDIPKIRRSSIFYEVFALRESGQGSSNNVEGMEAQRQQDFKTVLRRWINTSQRDPVMIVNQIRRQHRGTQGNLS
jgi:hypothetical protein